MDIKLRYQFEQMNKMLAMLEAGVLDYAKKLRSPQQDEHDIHSEAIYYRDALIKRLEITVDGFWKFLRNYMEAERGTVFESLSPKFIIRTVALERLISEEEASKLITMIEERNKTCHMYQQEIADKIAKEAHHSLKIMQTIFRRCAKASDLS